ncbi:MAG: sulfotransferase domain-containing protein [Crocosphaera sp.]
MTVQVNYSDSKSRGIIVHSLHKSASMFLYKFFKDLSERKSFQYFSVNNSPANRQNLDINIQTNFCICPERKFNFEQHNYPHISEIIHIVQIRDPRDILVSEYFSNAWIHPDTQWSEERKELRTIIQQMSIDEYVVEGAEKLGTFGEIPLKIRYQPILNLSLPENHQIIIIKYEDMITDFKNWLGKSIKPFQFDLNLEPFIIEEYYNKYKHEFTEKSETLEHKRKMTPGDHKQKLKPDTIDKLNDIFKEVLSNFYSV